MRDALLCLVLAPACLTSTGLLCGTDEGFRPERAHRGESAEVAVHVREARQGGEARKQRSTYYLPPFAELSFAELGTWDTVVSTANEGPVSGTSPLLFPRTAPPSWTFHHSLGSRCCAPFPRHVSCCCGSLE